MDDVGVLTGALVDVVEQPFQRVLINLFVDCVCLFLPQFSGFSGGLRK